MIIKDDQEPAIVDLRNAVKDERSGTIMPEEAPVKDSKSSGEIERAIQEMQMLIICTKPPSSVSERHGRPGSCKGLATASNPIHPSFPPLRGPSNQKQNNPTMTSIKV